ncbi:MAG TPA: sortase [Candidatus Dojkabacteria bacterium]|nr:sortase [Candidatus Dojkabacteria bacterium]
MSKNKRVINKKVLVGVILLLLGLTALLLTYWPVIRAKISQCRFSEPSTTNVVISENQDITKEITPDTEEVILDPKFGLYIPKIKSNASVVADVNAYDKGEYIKALETGIAHAKGTVTPNKEGNVFLFAHSAVNFYERNKYDVYFYLLHELKKDDEIFVSYDGIIYKYRVQEVKIVNRDEVKYLSKYSDEDTLTLMTCYPAGTDWKRTIVIAHRDNTTPFL